MTDIVERLKEAHPRSQQYALGSNILLEAAEEIERLRALPLLQFTSVDDELPEKPDVYLCKFADGDIQSFPFTDPGGFATENYSPEMKVVAWCDPNSLPSAADTLARAQAVAVADALDGFSVDYWIMAMKDNPECPGNTASACVADDAERRAKAARDSARRMEGCPEITDEQGRLMTYWGGKSSQSGGGDV